MEILLKGAHIIDPSSPFHQQQANIIIRNGIIQSIGTAEASDATVIDLPGLCVSPGWLDPFAHFCDPGLEYRETLESGTAAAAAGGYTDVMVLPNTTPVVHNKSAVEYLVQKGKQLAVNIHPIGAVTRNAEGKELSEMYDMHASGAVAFGDGICTVQSSGLLLKALQYVKAIDKVVIQLPDDHSISATGLMNEGIVSTTLGLPGKPAIAEELMIRRDIELASYTGSRIHITGVSTARGMALIREAKSQGVKVSCSVTPYHLWFCDEDLVGYDTNLKVNPPLRTRADREALRQAVTEGVVDCIASHHLPHNTDHKIVEFEYAKYGMTGLETAFALVKTALPQLSPEQLVALFATNARRLFDLPAAGISEGSAASLTLFLPDEQWAFTKSRSRSGNTPFFGQSFSGKPVGIIQQDKLFLND